MDEVRSGDKATLITGSAGRVLPPSRRRQDCVMQLGPDAEFVGICHRVAHEGWTDDDWAERESDDWFQTASFCGGYDADERAFCFSYYDASGMEWWFQVSLPDALMISAGEDVVIELRRAQ